MDVHLSHKREGHKAMNHIIPLFLMSLFACSVCRASGDIPLGMVLYSDIFFFLIPIIVIEVFVFRGALPRLPWTQNVKAITLSNLASTLAGGICMALPIILLEIFFLFSVLGHTWLKMDEGLGGHILKGWVSLQDLILNTQTLALNGPLRVIAVVVAMTLFITPFYFFSAWIKGKMNRRYLQDVADPQTIKKLTWWANGVSYTFVILALSYITIKNPSVLMTGFEFILGLFR